jgi:hypothetical protein
LPTESRPITSLSCRRLPNYVDRLIELMEAIGQPVKLIIIDTLSETAIGLKENLQEDMSLYFGAAKRFKAELGAAPLLIHHKNKAGTGMRGSTVIPGVLDMAIEVNRPDESERRVTLLPAKQRGFDRFEPIYLQGDYVDLGIGRRPTLVFTPDDSPNPGISPLGVRIPAKQMEALAALGKLGKASFSAWRNESGIAERTFADAKRKLLSRGLVQGSDHLFWVTDLGRERLGAK